MSKIQDIKDMIQLHKGEHNIIVSTLTEEQCEWLERMGYEFKSIEYKHWKIFLRKRTLSY